MSTDMMSIKDKFDNIKLCVFDMAGTTVDEDNLVYKTVCTAINQTLTADDKKVDLATCLAIGAGKEKQQAIHDILSELDLAAADVERLTAAAFKTFKTQMATAYSAQTLSAFDGIQALFDALKASGKKVVLNTGYDSYAANNILAILGWSVGREIDALITADDVRHGRPAPDMITLAMAKFGIKDPTQVLKAGDSGIDIEEGKNANCGLCIGVLSGAQTKAQLERHAPDLVLQKLTDLAELIEQ